MATWSTFAEAAPDLASETRRLIDGWGRGGGLLATVRGDDLPRIHPVSVAVVDGRLSVFVIARSPKRIDLEVASGWAFTVDDGYALFELDIEHVLVGVRPTADDWPPVYTSWHEGAAG